MKTRNYEKKGFILISASLTIIGEMILLFNFNNIKINQYKSFPIILVEKKMGYVIVKKEDRKLLYENSHLYIKDEKRKYKIKEDQRINQEEYYKILLEIPKLEKDQKNEVITFSIRKKKISMIEIIKRTWGGD